MSRTGVKGGVGIVDQDHSRTDLDILSQGKPSPSEKALVEAIIGGDEGAFLKLFNDLHPSLLRLARNHLPSWSIAEEVAQETWMAVLEGLDRFECRCSLKTWVYSILLNRARRRGERERRSINSSALQGDSRHQISDRGTFETHLNLSSRRGHWSLVASREYGRSPEDQLLMTETLSKVEAALKSLPEAQRNVVILRDTLGWKSAEVSRLLHISNSNERVLLHRARKAIQKLVLPHLKPDSSEPR